jgi:ADP-ribose pyrophosphatase YjhB (NUDIX family)
VTRRPRVIALCVFRDAGRILVFHVEDADDAGWRPLGGQVEWGERARDAVVREIREELGLDIGDPILLGTVENLFTYRGDEGHEIVFVFDALLPDPSLYAQEAIAFVEGGFEGKARWKWLGEFEAPGAQPLYPDGLLELLKGLSE